MITIKIGNRGQITIPRDIRRQMGLNSGDGIALVADGDQMILRPVTQTLLDLRGSVQVSGAQDFDSIRKQVLDGRARQANQHDG